MHPQAETRYSFYIYIYSSFRVGDNLVYTISFCLQRFLHVVKNDSRLDGLVIWVLFLITKKYIYSAQKWRNFLDVLSAPSGIRASRR